MHPAKLYRTLAAAAAALALLSATAPAARADVGVPMLAVVWPASWLLLVPVILIEAWAAVRLLGVGLKQGVKASGIANLVSTLVGIPVTWGILVSVQAAAGWSGANYWMPGTQIGKLALTLLQSPWLMPYEGQYAWAVPAAAAVLCVPFFLMSVGVEGMVAGALLDPDRKGTWRWAWTANGLTYLMIWVYLGLMIWRAL